MLRAIQERLDELDGKKLDDFEPGRQLAFIELFEIMKTRHKIIWDVLNDKPKSTVQFGTVLFLYPNNDEKSFLYDNKQAVSMLIFKGGRVSQNGKKTHGKNHIQSNN